MFGIGIFLTRNMSLQGKWNIKNNKYINSRGKTKIAFFSHRDEGVFLEVNPCYGQITEERT